MEKMAKSNFGLNKALTLTLNLKLNKMYTIRNKKNCDKIGKKIYKK